MKKVYLSGLLLALIVVIDQSVKRLLFDQSVQNSGIGFGWLIGSNYPLMLSLSCLLTGIVAWFWYRSRSLSWLLVLAGALSNVIDRLLYGAVIDPLDLFGYSLNLADVVISAGVVLLVWRSFKMRSF
ncbi:signal peptidase II [Candidatus Berkelbacteria bacterium]|nr:signal peptidase II [Candidatus Berkelbacteria bacterium]